MLESDADGVITERERTRFVSDLIMENGGNISYRTIANPGTHALQTINVLVDKNGKQIGYRELTQCIHNVY